MRGVPLMKYQGKDAALVEAEARWNVYDRWSVVGFAGAGKVSGYSSDLINRPTVYTQGWGSGTCPSVWTPCRNGYRPWPRPLGLLYSGGKCLGKVALTWATIGAHCIFWASPNGVGKFDLVLIANQTT